MRDVLELLELVELDEDVARLVAQRLQFEFVNDSRLQAMTAEEFGAEVSIPDRAWRYVEEHMLARLASQPWSLCDN